MLNTEKLYPPQNVDYYCEMYHHSDGMYETRYYEDPDYKKLVNSTMTFDSVEGNKTPLGSVMRFRTYA